MDVWNKPTLCPCGEGSILRQPRLLPAVSDLFGKIKSSQKNPKQEINLKPFPTVFTELWVVWEGLWGEGVHICLTVKLLCKSKLVYVYWTHATWQRGVGGEAASIHMCWSSTKTENWLEADDPPPFSFRLKHEGGYGLTFLYSLRIFWGDVHHTQWNGSLYRNNGKEHCLRHG